MSNVLVSVSSLVSLPYELLDCVFSYIADQDTFAALALSSRCLRAAALPRIRYRAVLSTENKHAFYEATEQYMSPLQLDTVRTFNPWRPSPIKSLRHEEEIKRLRSTYLTEADIELHENVDEIICMYLVAFFENAKNLRLVQVEGVMPYVCPSGPCISSLSLLWEAFISICSLCIDPRFPLYLCA